MKKSCNSNDIHQEEQEQSKKLYRSVSESARHLDDAHSCAQHVADLFTPTLQAQRSKFQEYCERLIFLEPILFGRKAEELLWRKAYYDVICAAKKIKKKEYTPEDLCNIQTHINAGVGHYHHFISRLQYQFGLDLKHNVDFAIFKNVFKKTSTLLQKPEQIDRAKQSVHRCLIYLGDLNRYKLEIFPNWDPGLAIRYYLKAVNFNPEYGIPHNQMGTLASNQNRTLDAVYHYMCCLSCKHVFEGTENNLLRLFEKNSHTFDDFNIETMDCISQLEPVDHIKCFTARFLLLIEAWFFNRKIPDIFIVCHQTNMDLQECLSYSKPISENGALTNDGDSTESDSLLSPAYITEDMVFKITIICLLCITKLQKSQSNQVSTSIAFTLAVYSQLLQIVTDHIYESLLNITYSNGDFEKQSSNGSVKHESKKKRFCKKQKLTRRRRKRKVSSDEESDLSGTGELNDNESNSDVSVYSDDDVDESYSENESADDSMSKVNQVLKNDDSSEMTISDIAENNLISNNKEFIELANTVKKIDPNTMLEIISEERLLCSIKVLSDWFISDTDIVKSCSRSTRSLLRQIVHLINFLNVNFQGNELTNLKYDLNYFKQNLKGIALYEDTALRGVEILSHSNQEIDWNNHKELSIKEDTIVRILKLISFGHSLTKIEETGINFDEKSSIFNINTVETEELNGLDTTIYESDLPEVNSETMTLLGNKDIITNENKGQIIKMKHMGQLWLTNEVRALETRVKGKTSLSPYLILDADCLTLYSSIVKHLVTSRKFIVIIPSAVVAALDDLKCEQSEARDAIRWLEFQLHHGNRFCRAQRPQERASLPLIKYPKKKDKEMSTYIQVIECCHYFVQKQKDGVKCITLLLGSENTLSNSENRELSYTGLAHSAGINLELITIFYENWKKNVKSKK